MLPIVLSADDNASIIALLYDDSGEWVSFSGEDDSATISYSGSNEKDYNLRVTLTFPFTATEQSVTITLAEGLKFQDDGATALIINKWLIDDLVVSEINEAPFGLSTEMINTGSKTYTFISNAETVTINLTIRADSRFWYDSIEDAVTVIMNCDGVQEAEAVLEELVVDCPTRTLHTGIGSYTNYVSADSTVTIASGCVHLMSLTSAWEICPVFYDEFIGTIKMDSNVVVTNTDPANWSMTSEVVGSETLYSFEYLNAPGLLASPVVPASFYFPSQHFPEGSSVVAIRSATASLAGEVVADWPDPILKFIISNGNIDLFVNYINLTEAQKNGAPANATSTARTGTTSPTISGVVGWYTFGNRGGMESDEQTIELNFDGEKLGVLGITLAIPNKKVDGVDYPHTVSGIYYKTTNNPEWQYTPRTITPTGAATYVDLSWAMLGIVGNPMETGNYITAIKYTLKSIYGSTVVGMASGDYRNAIYGVTLEAGLGEMAYSSISIYSPSNADNPDEWITGVIESDHRRGYVSLLIVESAPVNPGVLLSVSKTGGEIFKLSQKITVSNLNWVSNSARNNAVAHPLIYLRSESGNFITNIKIVNSRNVDITKYLIITYEEIDGVLVYTIDTSAVPGDAAVVAHTIVNPSGTLRNDCSLTLSYEIATKLTDDSGDYRYAHMIFVESPKETEYPTTLKGASIHTGTHPTYGVGTGDGIIWGLDTSNVANYKITRRTDITVNLSATNVYTGEPNTWIQGDDPIDIIAGNNTVMELTMDVINHTGTEVINETIIYLPIPKAGENWGDLMYGSDDFSFSMILNGEIIFPEGADVTILYGTIPPTDNGTDLNSYYSTSPSLFEEWDAENAASYNCIRVVLNTMPISDEPISFTLPVVVDETTPGFDVGLTDAWKPCYYEDLRYSSEHLFSKWETGAYIALETVMTDIYDIYYENLFDATNDENPTYYTVGVGVESFLIPGPREGYAFTGWYNELTGGELVTEIGDSETGQKTLYARWELAYNFIFYKVDGLDYENKLAGAKFAIYIRHDDEDGHAHDTCFTPDSACFTKVGGDVVSDEDGKVDFGGLIYGVYILVELEAPDTYITPTGQWQLTIDDNDSSKPIDIQWVGSEMPPAFSFENNVYTLPNLRSFILPISGAITELQYMLFGFSLMASAAVIVIIYYTKNKTAKGITKRSST